VKRDDSVSSEAAWTTAFRCSQSWNSFHIPVWKQATAGTTILPVAPAGVQPVPLFA
jgi:hypothetical protein